MTYTAYFLRFTTPLHIGDYKPDSYEKSESFLRSDTLAAAIIATWAKQGHEDWINGGDLPFTLSSAFPFYDNMDNEVVFFPRLKSAFNLSDRDSSLSKTIKKVSWLDQTYFEKVLNGDDVSHQLGNKIKGEFLSDVALPDEPFMYKQETERVKIPRERSDTGQSEPYYVERIYFNNAGLYFLAIGSGFEKLEEALELLQYEGFGTDRSIGNGFFTYSKREITLRMPDESNYSASLGLYVPDNKEAFLDSLDENTAYDLIKRGGWISTPGYQTLEKNSIYMFTEGSIFKKNKAIDGIGNIDLSPANPPTKLDHKIYRSGKTIFVPVKM